MDEATRQVWNSIARGYRPNPYGDFNADYLLTEATDDETRFIFRIFGDADDEMMTRWLRIKASFNPPRTSSEVLLQQASRWVSEVARSAGALGFTELVRVCNAGCEFVEQPDPRPGPGTPWQYDLWVEEIHETLQDAATMPGVDESRR